MGHGPRYRVPWRRRREGKTNYYKRLKLIKSGKPRMIVRRSLKYVTVQFAEARIEGDRVIAAAHSRELAKRYGWKGGTSNTSAAYLTGLLAGFRARLAGVEEAVLDIGLADAVPGSRVFAALKGALDAGIKIPHSENILPSEERIKGEHIALWAEDLAESNPEKYKKQFSKYLERGFKPEALPSHFEEVAEKIRREYEIKLGRSRIQGGGEE
jgi:large subunit ribosomal protein L18